MFFVKNYGQHPQSGYSIITAFIAVQKHTADKNQLCRSATFRVQELCES